MAIKLGSGAGVAHSDLFGGVTSVVVGEVVRVEVDGVVEGEVEVEVGVASGVVASVVGLGGVGVVVGEC